MHHMAYPLLLMDHHILGHRNLTKSRDQVSPREYYPHSNLGYHNTKINPTRNHIYKMSRIR